MLYIWKKRYDKVIKGLRFRDHARMIRKNQWITKLEFENIRRKVL